MDGAVLVDCDVPGHAELDDVAPELGVDDAGEEGEDIFGAGRRDGDHEAILPGGSV